jgi:hypothetical protein
MTKGELNNKAWELFWGRIDPAKFAAYVDEFERALLQQPGKAYAESEIREAAKYTAIGEGLLNDLFKKINEIRIEAKTP